MDDAAAAEPRPAAGGLGARLRALLSLAWPIVVSRSAQVVVGIADAVMVAHLGPAALAATTTGAMNAFALFILPMGVTFLVSSFASQLFGMGDLAGARRYGWYGLAVALAAQIAAVAALPLVPAGLGLFDYAPDVRASMQSYLWLRLPCAGAVVGIEALGSYFGGLGDTRPQMRASVAAMVLNVLGNWILIDGHLGAPALGVAGAALASSLSSGIAFLGLFALFVRDCRRHGTGRLARGELARLVRFGLPSGVSWFLEHAAFLLFVNAVVVGLGTVSLAALMTVIQVNSVAFMPTFGLASAGAILVGQAIGAGRKDHVPGLVGLGFGVAATWQTAVALAYLAAPDLVLSAFAGDPASAPAFLSVARRMLVISAAWQLFDAAANVLAEALRAAGDTAFTMWIRVAVAWAFFVPAGFLAVRVAGGGEAIAIAAFVAYLFVLALALFLRFRSGAWRRIVLVEPRLV